MCHTRYAPRSSIQQPNSSTKAKTTSIINGISYPVYNVCRPWYSRYPSSSRHLSGESAYTRLWGLLQRRDKRRLAKELALLRNLLVPDLELQCELVAGSVLHQKSVRALCRDKKKGRQTW